MKRFNWRWLAASSLLCAMVAAAQTRPQYGGTLRVTTHATLTSLDPADATQTDSVARRSLLLMMFDTLVAIDDNGRIQPALATSWQASSGGRRWQLRLRRGVKFDDGTPLTAEIAVSSLRAANASWNVRTDADSVVIELETENAEFPAELALARNAIAKRGADGKVSGTGAFHAVEWEPGKKLGLAATENYWSGRPFLDRVEIEMGKGFRDQITALELGKADVVEVPPEQLHRLSSGVHAVSSQPAELLALVFAREAASPEEKMLHEALALSIERGSIRSVLLQGAGVPAASILPNWMSGYGFVFPSDADLPRARHECEQVKATIHSIPVWSLGYDSNDPLARLLAERIALNARDAGLSLQPTSATAADVRLTRIALSSSDPWVALSTVAAMTGATLSRSKDNSAQDLYSAEEDVLASQRIIPLFHLPASYATAAGVKDFRVRPDGSWDLSNMWLGGASLGNHGQ